ncbi:putative choline kinase 1 [Glycine soja]
MEDNPPSTFFDGTIVGIKFVCQNYVTHMSYVMNMRSRNHVMKCNSSESHSCLKFIVATSNSLHTGNKPSNAKVNQLVKAAEKYTLANHLFWGLWGFISITLLQKRLSTSLI